MEEFKNIAAILAETLSIKHTLALEFTAKAFGFKNYQIALVKQDKITPIQLEKFLISIQKNYHSLRQDVIEKLSLSLNGSQLFIRKENVESEHDSKAQFIFVVKPKLNTEDCEDNSHFNKAFTTWVHTHINTNGLPKTEYSITYFHDEYSKSDLSQVKNLKQGIHYVSVKDVNSLNCSDVIDVIEKETGLDRQAILTQAYSFIFSSFKGTKFFELEKDSPFFNVWVNQDHLISMGNLKGDTIPLILENMEKDKTLTIIDGQPYVDVERGERIPLPFTTQELLKDFLLENTQMLWNNGFVVRKDGHNVIAVKKTFFLTDMKEKLLNTNAYKANDPDFSINVLSDFIEKDKSDLYNLAVIFERLNAYQMDIRPSAKKNVIYLQDKANTKNNAFTFYFEGSVDLTIKNNEFSPNYVLKESLKTIILDVLDKNPFVRISMDSF